MERRTPSEETHTQREDSHGYRDRDELHGCKTRIVKDHGNNQKLREKAWPCYSLVLDLAPPDL